MGCRRASSTLLVVLLAVSLLALARPVAHARHVKSPSMAPGEHSSTRKGMQGAASKPGVANTRKTETVDMKGSTTNGPNFGHGASPEVSEVVVQHYGPRSHPKKHN